MKIEICMKFPCTIKLLLVLFYFILYLLLFLEIILKHDLQKDSNQLKNA